MGHNVSERKVEQGRGAETAGAPPGWRWSGARLEAVNTVQGLADRGGVYLGECRARPECRRRLEVDLGSWRRHGFGDMPLTRVAGFYVCARLDGCGLSFRESFPLGVPLISLVQESPEIALQLTCKGCHWNTSWLVTRIIERLIASGRGGPNTPCHGFMANRPCPKCQASKWDVMARRPHAQGQGQGTG